MDSIIHFLYHLPAPAQPRTQPMQVLALGMPRSGTESLRQALLILGFDHTWHGFDQFAQPSDFEVLYHLCRRKWDNRSPDACNDRLTASDFDAMLGHCVAVTDIQAAAFAAELIQAYPDAKVILNYRSDEEMWYQSLVTTLDRGSDFWVGRFATLFCAEAFWARRATIDYVYTGLFRGGMRQTAKWVRREHHAMIRGMVSSERLLEWCVEDGWDPLCKVRARNIRLAVRATAGPFVDRKSD